MELIAMHNIMTLAFTATHVYALNTMVEYAGSVTDNCQLAHLVHLMGIAFRPPA